MSIRESTAHSPTTVAPTRQVALRLPARWCGVAGIVALTVWFVTAQSPFNLYVFNSCLLACIGGIALNLLMGTAGQVSIGSAAFLASGAFTAVWSIRVGLPFPVDVAVGALAAGSLGAIVAIPALRLRGLALAMATLSAHFLVLFFANQYQARADGAGAGGFLVTQLFASKRLDTAQRYWAAVLCALVCVLVLAASRIVRGKVGRAWRMIRDHESVAPTLGIDVARYKLAVFVASSMLFGIQGALLARFSGQVSTDGFTLLVAVQYLAMIMIGGMDSIVGSVVGVTIVTTLPTILPKLLSHGISAEQASANGAQYTQITYGVLLVVFVAVARGGIVGWARDAARHLGSMGRPPGTRREPARASPDPT